MSDPKQHYGDEYPDAVNILGVRMSLKREGRFSRYYHSNEKNAGAEVSKFEDGTASISMAQLRNEWSGWSALDRLEFASACRWLRGQPDFPDILRFLMSQDDVTLWSCLALPVGDSLPQEEAFELLVGSLNRLDAHTANITQGIAATKHPLAKEVLSKHLDQLWQHPRIWEDDPFTNWPAFDAICCIQHLLQLGVSPAALEDKVRLLSGHACAGTRESCAGFLHEYYDWLAKPEFRGFGDGSESAV